MFSIKAEPRRTEVPCNLSKHPSCRYYIAKGREGRRGGRVRKRDLERDRERGEREIEFVSE